MKRVISIFIGIAILLISVPNVFSSISLSEIAKDVVRKPFVLKGRTNSSPNPKISSVTIVGYVKNNTMTVDFEGEVSDEYITIEIASLTGENYIYTSVFVDESGILRLDIDLEDGEDYSIVILSEDVIFDGEMQGL